MIILIQNETKLAEWVVPFLVHSPKIRYYQDVNFILRCNILALQNKLTLLLSTSLEFWNWIKEKLIYIEQHLGIELLNYATEMPACYLSYVVTILQLLEIGFVLY